nr:hypothetical protein [uncultured Psychrobacter sp.]
MLLLVDTDNPEEIATADAIISRLAVRAIERWKALVLASTVSVKANKSTWRKNTVIALPLCKQ